MPSAVVAWLILDVINSWVGQENRQVCKKCIIIHHVQKTSREHVPEQKKSRRNIACLDTRDPLRLLPVTPAMNEWFVKQVIYSSFAAGSCYRSVLYDLACSRGVNQRSLALQADVHFPDIPHTPILSCALTFILYLIFPLLCCSCCSRCSTCTQSRNNKPLRRDFLQPVMSSWCLYCLHLLTSLYRSPPTSSHGHVFQFWLPPLPPPHVFQAVPEKPQWDRRQTEQSGNPRSRFQYQGRGQRQLHVQVRPHANRRWVQSSRAVQLHV